MRHRFCWMDIKTRDIAATAEFFTSLLDWRFTVDENDPRRPTVITTARMPIGGVSDLAGPLYPPGTPPHIAFYLAVDDVDRRTETALAQGADLVLEPFDAGTQGRVATLLDPAGAAVSLWQAREFRGWVHPPSAPNTPAVMVHVSADAARARNFYHQLLGDDPAAAEFVTAQHADPQWETVIAVENADHLARRVRDTGRATPGSANDSGDLRLTTTEGLSVRARRA